MYHIYFQQDLGAALTSPPSPPITPQESCMFVLVAVVTSSICKGQAASVPRPCPERRELG